MIWLDWLKITAVLLAIVTILMTMLVGLLWLCTKPIGRHAPQRVVDVRNRGRTRIRMPDGSIK